ncbi:MAG TPA: zinc ribbon domain-containing protein [Candidatus Nitrosocosmicus sp.]|nr:zinc ribbon domain-containing protein [Candidatus Nitrosocosmicus sp.]
MNKAYSMVAAFSLVMGSILLLPVLNIAYAQYGGSGAPGGVTLEEQLTLAKEKISNAQQQGAYGSGTAMFGTNLDSTVLMIIAIVVIIGGVSAAFFAAGGVSKKKSLAVTADGTHTVSGKFCTNCGTQLSEGQKFCGSCGTKA